MYKIIKHVLLHRSATLEPIHGFNVQEIIAGLVEMGFYSYGGIHIPILPSPFVFENLMERATFP